MASAEQMLLEIRSESLQKLLTRVRQQSKRSSSTGIPSLDAYLSTGSTESESGIPASESLGNAIRIEGSQGSGKTHLLYFLVATTVLPVSNGGCNKITFVVDLDGHFQITRFREILVDRLKRNSIEAASISTIAEQCLESVHVFRPSSSGQFAVTLAHLHDYYTRNLPRQELGMVAVHSIDAFYWLDRFKAEQLVQSNLTTKTTYSEQISSILADLRISYGLTTVITLWRPPQQIIHPNRQNLANNADRDGLFLPPDFPAATLVLDPIQNEEDRSHGTKVLWRAQAQSRSQPCVFPCAIDDRGVLMY